MAAGVNHFIQPEIYLKMMPPYLPLHAELVYLSGFAELVLGALLLVPPLRRFAAYGIIALLLAVFPANLYMFTSGIFEIPEWLLLLRLPFQLVFIVWALWHTKP